MSNSQFIGGNNTFRTASLFLERWQLLPPTAKHRQPLFSLHSDVEGLINAQATFVEEGDPTGYKWSQKYIGGYPHWSRLIQTDWFKAAVDLWVSELYAKMRSEALQKVEETASGTSRSAFQAAKYLVDRSWEKPTSQRGRPSKQEINNELRRSTALIEQDEEDFKRAALKLVVKNN